MQDSIALATLCKDTSIRFLVTQLRLLSVPLSQLKVPSSDKPEVSVNFRSLLLDRCQKEFEREKNDCETLERKQSEVDSAKDVRIVALSP